MPTPAPALWYLALVALGFTPFSGAAGEATSIGDCASQLATPAPATAQALPSPLRITTWNSMKFSRDGSPLVLTALAGESDLLLLQESLRDTAPVTEHPHRLFADGYQSGATQTGVETRSAVAADVSCSLRFMEPWLRTPKAMSVARFPIEGSASLLVINLHAVNFTLGITEYTAQFAAVGELLDRHTGPTIVAGDFNNWSEQRQEVLREFVERHALEAIEITPDLRSLHLGVPVDGIYLRGLRSATASAFPTVTSDHHPISAVLQLAPDHPAANTLAQESAPAAVP